MSTEGVHSYKPTDEYVRIIGRTCYYNEALWLALSGGGIEFSFYGKKAEITIKGDNIALTDNSQARIGIEVNGRRVVDDIVNTSLKTYTVLESDSEQNVTVRVIKLSRPRCLR